MKRPEDVRLGAPVYCDQCDCYHPFGRHVQRTTPIKIPTLAELHVTQIYHLLEKMVAKEICSYNDDITGWRERNA